MSGFALKCLSTEAAILLNKAGYVVVRMGGELRAVQSKSGGRVAKLLIIDGCVDNAEVEKLLRAVKL